MSAIYLIRHGQASAGAEDYDELSPLGCQQAAHLGAELARRGVKPAAVICGALRRHQQTAEHCLTGAGLGLEWQTLPQWNEYDHRQILSAYNPEYHEISALRDAMGAQADPAAFVYSELKAAFARWLSGEHDADYVESAQAFRARVQMALAGLPTPGAGPIWVFTSGGPITVVTQTLLGLEPRELFSINARLVNAGITKLVPDEAGWGLVSLNEHAAFEGRPEWITTL
ncbi:histidine phosphatase family protein [Ferrimonas balearica]|uniref:histidine phosphatase family protein n=1 Tax=Ferrimonas balearica TaxID=44012 RepID=UPI001C9975D1|nr:histidine phosphatase family protein [Ferrimonas balearica]MBY5921582.1 histidine phosphatase family protein [Ferrimonas balearica]MBY5995078.1 histidine phosphatase family protein [Ferrimonas balearica]